MQTGILIPYYNAGTFIGPLVEAIHELHVHLPILIVNDGSRTPPPLKPDTFLHIIHLEQNRGKGHAIKTGMEWFAALPTIQAVITMDADGQHAPEDMGAFLSEHAVAPDSLIVGRRTFSPAVMPLSRVISNSLSSALLSRKLRTHISDSQCGFRLIPRSLFPVISQCRENGFQFETEMLIRVARNNNTIRFIPIRTIYNNSESSINKWQDIRTFTRLFFHL